MSCGIYKITNKINSKSYIGQSINIEERWRQHKKDCGRLDSSLYRAIRKYGIDNFTFEVVEEMDPNREIMYQKESFYVNKFDTLKNGYNDIEPTLSVGILNRALTDEEVIDIRTRKFNGETIHSVYKDYSKKMGKGGFESVWNGSRYSHIAMEEYTKDKLKELHRAHLSGENNPKAKLTEKDVIDIRTRKKNGEAFRFVYADYKNIISYGGMRQVWGGQSWKHIQIS